MKKELAAAACCLAMAAAPVMAGCAPEQGTKDGAAPTSEAGKQNYKDGTYTGKGKGRGGDIEVTLIVKDGVVSVDSLTGDQETKGIGGYEAIQDGTFKASIEKAQSAAIDTVSGATLTTNGVKEAVTDALSKA